jgi:hypothetical protein
MALEEELLKALKERVLRMASDMPMLAAPPINIYNGMPSSISETLNAGGSNSPGFQAEAAKAGLSPEELEYVVDIEKRDAFDPKTMETIGWNKNVKRYTVPKGSIEKMLSKKKNSNKQL